MQRMVRLALAAVLLTLPAGAAMAADGEALLREQCAGCHNLTGPAPATVAEIQARKGPDLFHAGNKYRQEWIAGWLQKPTRIRPAGMFYGNHIKPADKWDTVDTATLPAHPALGAEEAEAAAQALMARKANSELVAGVAVQPVSLSLMMGDMMFDKFKGCIACHMSGRDYGGFSGPELYTAHDRLQPAYIYSYIQNPQAWDPKVWMPNPGLQQIDLNKLVRYLELIAEAEKKP